MKTETELISRSVQRVAEEDEEEILARASLVCHCGTTLPVHPASSDDVSQACEAAVTGSCTRVDRTAACATAERGRDLPAVPSQAHPCSDPYQGTPSQGPGGTSTVHSLPQRQVYWQAAQAVAHEHPPTGHRPPTNWSLYWPSQQPVLRGGYTHAQVEVYRQPAQSLLRADEISAEATSTDIWTTSPPPDHHQED
ncbi:hypothetical protein HPB50_025593 [Hyalomma asiaticum]|uniref:Uncharacterized protein n=1 Tax=Hyalomma asiaticum TaxID=266040 RepID=A0ACB7TR33_HYAAI|nr:hypothetical protein HPB50_025593 [Hyalomma asiaticum]